MKMKIQTLAAVISLHLSLPLFAEDLPPVELRLPQPKEPFRIEELSAGQVRLCAQFRRLAGKFRKPAIEAVLASGAFPLDEKRITVDQVVALFGDPEGRGDHELNFSLGSSEGTGHAMFVTIIDGRAARIGFASSS